MSETVLRILIDELGAIRLICEKCHAVIELPIDSLDRDRMMTLSCPGGCGSVYRTADKYLSDPLAKLAVAIRELKQVKACRIEFVLPEK